MRTLLILLIGIVAVWLLVRYCPSAHRRPAVVAFALVWLVACGWNLAIGLSHGYALGEELAIHAVLFGIPVGLAWWRLWRRVPPSA
ncbi:hypothetical protein [Halomonas caseinilytica]|uniref:Uncharacterized protein n=1 Tax=Halomonas caseinilytica TaxID=438744 RepID=A0A1M6QIQ2_9GAMM|nr:hypothetical protein [Halomonas caseinilytica]SEL97048.1 hypothetical protein SAMN04487952_10120 [Halomonas caseinilytica]SHK19897.1 hypothetical protein SAMN05192556_10221 [Halomonas caseinilytica]